MSKEAKDRVERVLTGIAWGLILAMPPLRERPGYPEGRQQDGGASGRGEKKEKGAGTELIEQREKSKGKGRRSS